MKANRKIFQIKANREGLRWKLHLQGGLGWPTTFKCKWRSNSNTSNQSLFLIGLAPIRKLLPKARVKFQFQAEGGFKLLNARHVPTSGTG